MLKNRVAMTLIPKIGTLARGLSTGHKQYLAKQMKIVHDLF